MSYNVKSIRVFERQAKKLNKKYPSLKRELSELVQELKHNPRMGAELSKNCYKIRLKIKSKGKGKSGGARVITNLAIQNKTVYLLNIYDKSKKDSLSKAELDELLASVPSD